MYCTVYSVQYSTVQYSTEAWNCDYDYIITKLWVRVWGVKPETESMQTVDTVECSNTQFMEFTQSVLEKGKQDKRCK